MTARVVPLALLSALMACGPRFRSVVLDPEAPLEAALLPPRYGDIGFWLSHPAHVAVFEIVPGRGVGLLFPSLAGERNFMARPGSYNARTLTRSVRWAYASSWGTESYLRSRYLLLVASRAPLKLDDLVGNPLGLRARLDFASFASVTPFAPLRALTDLVVPNQPANDWATAFYVVSGGASTPRVLQAVRVGTCPDGRMMLVPWSSWPTAADCAGLRAAPAEPAPADSVIRPNRDPRDIKERLGEEVDRKFQGRPPISDDAWVPEFTGPSTEAEVVALQRATPRWVQPPDPDGDVQAWGFLQGGPKAAIAGRRRLAGESDPGPGWRPGSGYESGPAGRAGTGSSNGTPQSGPGASSTGNSSAAQATADHIQSRRPEKPQDPGAQP